MRKTIVATPKDSKMALPLVPSPTDSEVKRAGSDSKLTQMLTYAQAAEYLNVPVGTLYDWVHRKVVPHIRLGPRLVRFPLRALTRWLEARAVAEAQQ